MGLIGKATRPLRRWLEGRGVQTVMLKNPGELGFAGFSVCWRQPELEKLLRCSLAHVPYDLGSARFLIAEEDDMIQKELAHGRFYEPEELEIIGRHFSGGTFVDIGANIGNHAVFAGLVLGADRLIAVEPNPLLAKLCELNLSLNDLGPRSRVERFGLSDKVARANLNFIAKYNVGAARLSIDEEGGSIELTTGDALLAGESPAFIKIDTEGFELKVLQGLERTLILYGPVLFVEVEDGNRSSVEALLTPLGYHVVESFARYPGLANYLYRRDPSAVSD